jgi:pimeloyl-ACP methyl ester carboxylesterase
VLLHGLVASGDTFGSGFDDLAERSRLVVPDLLGFGRSVRAGTDFSLDAHLDALDAMLADLGLDDARLVIGGHSMGGALALHWAARRAAQVERVVTWNATLFRDRQQGLQHVTRLLGPVSRLLALPNPLSSAVCLHLCTRRPELAGWVYAAVLPGLPVPLARQCAHHTWPSYLAGLDDIVLDPRWEQALGRLGDQSVPVLLAWGARDPIAVPALYDDLAARHRHVRCAESGVGDHYLPIAHPQWSAALIESTTAAPGPQPPHGRLGPDQPA